MWTRAELKQNAKELLKPNYLRFYFISLAFAVLSGDLASAFTGNSKYGFHFNVNLNGEEFIPSWIMPVSAVGGILAIVLAILYFAFVVGPLKISVARFYLSGLKGKPDFNTLEHGFSRDYYKNNVKAMFLSKLYIFLWSFLFIIPGIIKSYEYYFVSYILADDPNLTPEDAMAVSSNLTHGHKFSIFILDLSFSGWYFLGMLCLGVGLTFVLPYVQATKTFLYLRLKYLGLSDERNF